MNTGVKYPEMSWSSSIVGFVIGIALCAAFTYSGLLIGSIPMGSEIAAIVAFGVLRGIMKRGSILEVNISQTIGSAVNVGASGMCFIIPVLFIKDMHFNPVTAVIAGFAGALIGVSFIIPVRKQMIDIERLRFPSGVAVASILRAPAQGIAKSKRLMFGLGAGLIIFMLTQLSYFGLPEVLPEIFDFGPLFGIPAYWYTKIAVSTLALGAGIVAGPVAMLMAIGGILAFWVAVPAGYHLGWFPAELTGADVVTYAYKNITRPVGIGMLVGSTIIGISLVLPSIAAAFKGLSRASKASKEAGVAEKGDEMSIKFLYVAAVVAFLLIFFVAAHESTASIPRLFITSLVGVVWIWLAGMVVAQCTGLVDQSPISGMTMISLTITLLLLDKEVIPAVLVATACCMASSQCADMMQDLKTGHMVGARPKMQQIGQMIFSSFGPLVAFGVIVLLWKTQGFGEGHKITAPQAQAMGAIIDGITNGGLPYVKYFGGAALGAALSLCGVGSLGILVGLSFYIPWMYQSVYCLGGLAAYIAIKSKGNKWYEDVMVPIAAGLMVGEGIIVTIMALLAVFGVVGN